jgi:ubiquinone/menaquinone biosynthesis C-methylase UbiE
MRLQKYIKHTLLFEKAKYDKFALNERKNILNSRNEVFLDTLEDYIINPYLCYYDFIQKMILPEMTVLEIGAGTGNHTSPLINTGAKVTLLDYSNESLLNCKLKYPTVVKTVCANMENIPIQSNSFDFIVASGSMSYGNFQKITAEIFRLLKPEGGVILVDSLNNNLVYRLNRFRHLSQRKRTLTSIFRIPTIRKIELISSKFRESEIKFYGSYLWLVLPVKIAFGSKVANNINNYLEKRFPSNKNAFKFVIACRGFKEY